MKTIGIEFKYDGKLYYFNTINDNINVNDMVIVSTKYGFKCVKVKCILDDYIPSHSTILGVIKSDIQIDDIYDYIYKILLYKVNNGIYMYDRVLNYGEIISDLYNNINNNIIIRISDKYHIISLKFTDNKDPKIIYIKDIGDYSELIKFLEELYGNVYTNMEDIYDGYNTLELSDIDSSESHLVFKPDFNENKYNILLLKIIKEFLNNNGYKSITDELSINIDNSSYNISVIDENDNYESKVSDRFDKDTLDYIFCNEGRVYSEIIDPSCYRHKFYLMRESSVSLDDVLDKYNLINKYMSVLGYYDALFLKYTEFEECSIYDPEDDDFYDSYETYINVSIVDA